MGGLIRGLSLEESRKATIPLSGSSQRLHKANKVSSICSRLKSLREKSRPVLYPGNLKAFIWQQGRGSMGL